MINETVIKDYSIKTDVWLLWTSKGRDKEGWCWNAKISFSMKSKVVPDLCLPAATFGSRDDKGRDIFLECNIKVKTVSLGFIWLPLTPDWPCEESLQTEELFALTTADAHKRLREIPALTHECKSPEYGMLRCTENQLLTSTTGSVCTWIAPIHALCTFRKFRDLNRAVV